MEKSNLPNFLLSSTGEGLALRVKAFLVGILPAVLIIARLRGYTIAEQDASAVVDSIVTLIEGGITVISAVYMIIGFVRANHYKRNNLGKFAK